MVQISVSEFVKAPQEKVFSFVSNFEKAPHYSHYWKSVKVRSREGNATTFDTEANVVGKTIKSVTRIVTHPNEWMEAETLEGDGKGTKITSKFEPAPDGTRITIEGEIALPPILGKLIQGKIESTLFEDLKIVKWAIEKPDHERP
jgi:uncharacterized membrane protein